MRVRTKVAATLLTILSLTGMGIGLASADQDKKDAPVSAPVVTTEWYDIGDLVTAPGDDATPKVDNDQIRNLIIVLVDNPSWKDNGGDYGSIASFGHQLIIIQTTQNQQKIAALLHHLREQTPSRRTVTVDAYWLRLTPGQLQPGQTAVATELLNDPKVLYTRARATSVSGQPISIDVTRTGGPSPYSPADDPTTRPDSVGVTLEETPTLADGGTSVLVVANSTVTIPPESKSDRPTTRPDAAAPQPVIVLHTRGTSRLKPGIPTIVGGMTDQPGAADGRVMCLVLCATVDH